MPGMDKTGPLGTGPIGRGLGPCGGGTGGGWRRGGFGFERGFGRGRANWPISITAEDEKAQLENEKKWLEQYLETVDKRINELGTSQETE